MSIDPLLSIADDAGCVMHQSLVGRHVTAVSNDPDGIAEEGLAPPPRIWIRISR